MGNNRILYIQYVNPALLPPLQHSSQLLAERNWHVTFLGIAGPVDLTLKEHPSIRVKMLPYCRPGPRQKLHYVWFCLWTLLWALLWRPRWIYASDFFSSIPALLIRTFSRARLIYHEHDSPGPEVAGTSSFIRLMLRARRKVAARATLTVLPNEERLKLFVREIGTLQRTACVWNCPPLNEALSLQKRDTEAFVVHYQGSLVPIRLPLAVVRALSLLPETVSLQIAGYTTIGHPTHVEDLRRLAADLKVEHRFRFMGAVSREDLLKHCQAADLGLSFMPHYTEDFNERHMVGASQKPFEYLASGVPVLVSDLADWKDMYVNPGYGLACDPEDPERIAQAIRWCLDHRDETRSMGQRGRQRIVDEWHHQRQFEPVLRVLEEHDAG